MRSTRGSLFATNVTIPFSWISCRSSVSRCVPRPCRSRCAASAATWNSQATAPAACSRSGAISCAVLDDPEGDRLTIGEFLERGRYGRGLTDHFLAPMGAAIWSSSPARMREMPARFFVRFFDNHGLLGVRDAPQWYTIEGGSQSYVNALCARLRGRLELGAPARRVRRDDGGVDVKADGAARERFERVILACHPDQALALL